MRVRIINRWDEVDVEVVLFRRVHRLEAHIVDTFHLQHSAETFLRIAQRGHQSLAFLIDEVVDGRGVINLVGIFGAECPVAIAQVDATCGSAHIFRDIIEQALVILFLADEATADTHPELGVVQGGNALVEVPLAVDTAHDATVIVNGKLTFQIRCPIITLAAIQCLQCDTFCGTQHHTGATQGIVHAERPLLVGTEHKAAAKLVVDVAHRHADEAIVVSGIEVGHTHAIEFIAEAIQFRQERLEAKTSREVAVGIVDLSEAVDTELLTVKIGDADAVVEHVVLSVDLESTVHLAVFQKRLRARLETDRQSECE